MDRECGLECLVGSVSEVFEGPVVHTWLRLGRVCWAPTRAAYVAAGRRIVRDVGINIHVVSYGCYGLFGRTLSKASFHNHKVAKKAKIWQ
jgi:hypothetical protein